MHTFALICSIVFTNPLSPADTLVDVFPLSVGNQWTYRYWAHFELWTGEIVTDSGSVSYTITEKLVAGDSTQWTFQEIRDITSYISWNLQQRPGSRDTSYAIVDSSVFRIIELQEGRHRMYRNEFTGNIWESVFPWGINLTDTTVVFRYMPVDSLGESCFATSVPEDPTQGTFNFKLKAGVGLVSLWAAGGGGGWIFSTNHSLLKVTPVQSPGMEALPRAIDLNQNFPNPFNPVTLISFSLTSRTRAILTVFNVLGQPVAVLLNKEMLPGEHTIPWNAGALPSGVYFYRLETESGSTTRRAILLK